MRRVIISGLPRSGTSWVGKALSFAPDFTFYREPDNSEAVPGAPGREFWYNYLKAGDDPSGFSDHMDKALSGRIVTRWVLKEDLGPIMRHVPRRLSGIGTLFPALYRRRPNVLVKLVRSSLKLDWIAHRVPDAKIVSLIRHPVGQFASYRKLGWMPNTANLLSDERLIAEHLAPFADLMRSARTFWEHAGAFWGANNYVVWRQTQAGARHAIVPFEWLCDDGPTRLRDLSDRLGMIWTPRAAAFAAPGDAADGETYSLNRDSRAQIAKWRETVSADDIAACRAFAEPFGLPFYAGFDPREAKPIWRAIDGA